MMGLIKNRNQADNGGNQFGIAAVFYIFIASGD
jgi:hypothetical protein